MTSANGLEIVDSVGNDTDIKGYHCAQGKGERERTQYFALKSVQNATCTFWCLMVMEMLEMKRCAGMWVYRREVASFKR